jgi:hypothetical protein
MGLIISTNISDNGKIGINTPLLIKNTPTEKLSYILLSFSLANIASGVFGCMFMEITVTSEIKRKPLIYKGFVTISNIYTITMGSIYLTWALILFQLLLYISTIYYMDMLVESEQTRVIITVQPTVSIPTITPVSDTLGIITAEPCKDVSAMV